MPKITRVRDLIPDAKNANKGTPRGTKMLEDSLRACGAGRGVLIDKHGRILAGNKTIEAAGQIGITEVEVIQTDGRKIIAVQRTDLDLETDERAKLLAIADNRIAEVNLDWDADVLVHAEIDLSTLFSENELKNILGEAVEACELEECPTCGRKMPKNRSKVAKPIAP